MINTILSGIFKLIISLVSTILSPIDFLIAKVMPDLADGLQYVSGYFNWVCSLIPWGISWFGLSTNVISLFVAYVTFELTVPLGIHTVKLAIKWYDKLKI